MLILVDLGIGLLLFTIAFLIYKAAISLNKKEK